MFSPYTGELVLLRDDELGPLLGIPYIFPAWVLSCLEACVLSCPEACVLSCLEACVLSCLEACVLSCLEACVLSCLEACVLSCPEACLLLSWNLCLVLSSCFAPDFELVVMIGMSCLILLVGLLLMVVSSLPWVCLVAWCLDLWLEAGILICLNV